MNRALAAAVAALTVTMIGCQSSPAPAGSAPIAPAASGTPSATTLLRSAGPTAPPAARPLTLVFGGDVDFDRTTRTAIRAGGVDAPWRGIAPRLRAADLALLNLECALSHRGAPDDKTYTFRGDPAHVVGAARAGVDVFSLANNHTLDYGTLALSDTIDAVHRAGIAVMGAGPDLAAAQRPVLRTVAGRRIAAVGVSAIIPSADWRASSTRAGLAYDDDAEITKQVRRAAQSADIVIAFFHWGIEYTYQPSARQRRAARTAIRAGATIVVGTHPHVLQPVEIVDGRLVAWSLSNLVFQSRPASVRTALLTVTLQPDGSGGWRLDPYRISDGVPRPDPARPVSRGAIPAPTP